jgi:hypothetical protein
LTIGDYDNPADFPKLASRLWIVEEMRRCAALTTSDGVLRGDVVDLCGRGAPLLRVLLERGLLRGEGRYYGVDTVGENVAHNRRQYAQDAKNASFHSCRLESLFLGPESPRRCAMVVYDPCGAGDGREWRDNVRTIQKILQKGCQRLGGFVVALNGGIARQTTLLDFLARAAELGGNRDPAGIFYYQYRGVNTDEAEVRALRSWRAVAILHFRPPRVGVVGAREALLGAVRDAVAISRPSPSSDGRVSVVGRWPSEREGRWDELLLCGHLLPEQEDDGSRRYCPRCRGRGHAGSCVANP